MTNSYVPCNTSVIKTPQNNPNTSHPPLHAADWTQRISIRKGTEMGLSTPSGYKTGTRDSETVSSLPKVTQQEAGLPAPCELEQDSQGTLSSQASPPTLLSGPFSVAATSVVKSLETRRFISTQVTTAMRTMSSQPMKIWINVI